MKLKEYDTLPLNCDVKYYPNFLSSEEAWNLYKVLLEEYDISNQRLTIETGSGRIETDSFKILFATQDLIDQKSHPEEIHGKNFVYSGALKRLKEKVEKLTGKVYDLAMALYYPDGNFFAAYHYDQMTSGPETILPSLSLGEVREFCFKENDTGEIFSMDLDHGSLLVMGKGCQENYMHSLIQNPKYKNGRINITFREPNFH